MIVTITSCAPVKAFNNPGSAPAMAPPTIPATNVSGRWMIIGSLIIDPTTAPAIPPKTA